MFKQLLVPVDGSSPSTAALKCAIEVAKAFGGSITVITLFDPYPGITAGLEFAFAQEPYLDAIRAEADRTLKTACELIEAGGLKADARAIESQQIWRGIIEMAESIKADLIVIGSHGRSGLDRLVMGSVTQRVLQHTKQPVLVVRD